MVKIQNTNLVRMYSHMSRIINLEINVLHFLKLLFPGKLAFFVQRVYFSVLLTFININGVKLQEHMYPVYCMKYG